MKFFSRHITRCLIFTLAISFAAPVQQARADIDAAAKYSLQSVFLYNFISSVEWPRLMYSENVKNIELCIIGEDKLGKVMDEVAVKALAKGVKINIRRGVTADTAEECNIAYISGDAEAQTINAKLQGKPVLTVSESKGFAKNGGIIEFVLNKSSISFKINNHSAKEHGLKINPQLLETAVEVIN